MTDTSTNSAFAIDLVTAPPTAAHGNAPPRPRAFLRRS